MLNSAELWLGIGKTEDGLGYYYNESTLQTYFQQSPAFFAASLATLLNTWIGVGYCPECIGAANVTEMTDPYQPNITGAAAGGSPYLDLPVPVSPDVKAALNTTTAKHTYTTVLVYRVDKRFAGLALGGSIFLLLVGAASVLLESMLVAPDTLGYVSTAVRNSRYLHLAKYKVDGTMGGPTRARALRDIEVMMQDVKSDAEVGKIALGQKTDKAVRLVNGRVYR
jgi:hypothetical protein